MKFVPATCSREYAAGSVMFESLTLGLPAGLLAAPALVKVVRGTAYLPVVNVVASVVVLYPHMKLGVLQPVCVVSLPAGITVVWSDYAMLNSQSAHVLGPTVRDQIETLDLTFLPVE